MNFTHDNRWSPGSSGATVPDDAIAAYSARWIDRGCGGGGADVVGDRQGLAWNDGAGRQAILDALITHRPHLSDDLDLIPYDSRGELLMHRVLEGLYVFVARRGGYFYVDAYIIPTPTTEGAP